MKLVTVKFSNYYKEYNYYTNLNLEKGKSYNIKTACGSSYKNSVIVVNVQKVTKQNDSLGLKTIISADIVGEPRPKDLIDKVIFDEAKRTTVVLWLDGKKTIVHCQPEDEFDREKGIALCYMKRVLGNRGSFNETLKKHCWGD